MNPATAPNAILQAIASENRADHYALLNAALRSKRGIPLIATSPFVNGRPPTVTVEAYVKWYSLYLVRRVDDEFLIEEVPFPDDIEFCKPNESAYVDHVPNPYVVARWAAKHDYFVDELAMEAIVGRWEIESRNNYDDLWS